MMSHRRIPDSEIPDFLSNLIGRLTSHEISCFDAGTSDDLAAKLEALNVLFEERVQASLTKKVEKKAVNAAKRDERQTIVDEISTVKKLIEALGGEKTDLAMCGLRIPKQRSTVVADDPTSLSAVSDWIAGNSLSFKGNNRYPTVTYEIFRCSDDEPWSLIGQTKKQKFLDQRCEPGKSYMYRVKAVAAKTVSNYSNEAVVNVR